MGVYPESFIAPMRADVASLVARIDRAKPEGDAKLAMGKPVPAAAHHEGHAEEPEAAVHGEAH
jgi:NADH-quinone oxidoreductase subunit M